jgi:two-component system nitrogen regulation response regulator NtrX
VISATNRDLAERVAKKQFREDLYYRLCVVPIRVPPLRERPADIRPLAEYFLAEFCARNNFKPKRLDDGVFPALEAYAWPGNVRELRNVLERMAILTPGETLTLESVPLEIRTPAAAPSGLRAAREAAERDQIQRALEASGGNVSAAARALGLERTALHKRLRALALEKPGRR